MKLKLLNLGLLLTSLLGYLKWGGDNAAFLAEAEAEVLKRLLTEPTAVLHPFTVLPLVGQVLLVVTLFQRRVSKLLTLIGLTCLSLLLLLIFVIGIAAFEYRMVLSTLPFVVIGAFVVRELLRKNI
ncbi:MAG TPA: hypothetical protein PKC65_15480 [Pyrinomonadaceae bacterium]|nr:hypothetical protein [Pyrinomonadaceae bacterium]